MKLLNLGCGSTVHPAWTNVDFRETVPGVTACDLSAELLFESSHFDAVYTSHLIEHFPRDHAPKFLKDCFRVLRPAGVLRVVVPDLERLARTYLDLLEKAVNGDVTSCERYNWIIIEMLDQMVRNKPGGAMLEYWKKNPMPAENFVIKRVGSEVLRVLDFLRSTSNSSESSVESAQNHNEPQDPSQIGQFRLSGEVHQWMYDRYSLKVLMKNAGFVHIHVCEADESSIPDFNKYLLDIESDGSVRKPDSLFMEAIKPFDGSIS